MPWGPTPITWVGLPSVVAWRMTTAAVPRCVGARHGIAGCGRKGRHELCGQGGGEEAEYESQGFAAATYPCTVLPSIPHPRAYTAGWGFLTPDSPCFWWSLLGRMWRACRRGIWRQEKHSHSPVPPPGRDTSCLLPPATPCGLTHLPHPQPRTWFRVSVVHQPFEGRQGPGAAHKPPRDEPTRESEVGLPSGCLAQGRGGAEIARSSRHGLAPQRPMPTTHVAARACIR